MVSIKGCSQSTWSGYLLLEGKKINIEVAHLYGADLDEESEGLGKKGIWERKEYRWKK